MKTPKQGKPKGVDSSPDGAKRRAKRNAIVQAVTIAEPPVQAEVVAPTPKELLRTIVTEGGQTLEMAAFKVIGDRLEMGDPQVAMFVVSLLAAKDKEKDQITNNVQIHFFIPENNR